jgi:hypothetical protein
MTKARRSAAQRTKQGREGRLRQVAFDERRKIHDLLMEGVELALKKRGCPTLAELKARWERKGR